MEYAPVSKYMLQYLSAGFEVRVFNNGLGSITFVAEKPEEKQVRFVSEDGTTFVDPTKPKTK